MGLTQGWYYQNGARHYFEIQSGSQGGGGGGSSQSQGQAVGIINSSGQLVYAGYGTPDYNSLLSSGGHVAAPGEISHTYVSGGGVGFPSATSAGTDYGSSKRVTTTVPSTNQQATQQATQKALNEKNRIADAIGKQLWAAGGYEYRTPSTEEQQQLKMSIGEPVLIQGNNNNQSMNPFYKPRDIAGEFWKSAGYENRVPTATEQQKLQMSIGQPVYIQGNGLKQSADPFYKQQSFIPFGDTVANWAENQAVAAKNNYKYDVFTVGNQTKITSGKLYSTAFYGLEFLGNTAAHPLETVRSLPTPFLGLASGIFIEGDLGKSAFGKYFAEPFMANPYKFVGETATFSVVSEGVARGWNAQPFHLTEYGRGKYVEGIIRRQKPFDLDITRRESNPDIIQFNLKSPTEFFAGGRPFSGVKPDLTYSDYIIQLPKETTTSFSSTADEMARDRFMQGYIDEKGVVYSKQTLLNVVPNKPDLTYEVFQEVQPTMKRTTSIMENGLMIRQFKDVAPRFSGLKITEFQEYYHSNPDIISGPEKYMEDKNIVLTRYGVSSVKGGFFKDTWQPEYAEFFVQKDFLQATTKKGGESFYRKGLFEDNPNFREGNMIRENLNQRGGRVFEPIERVKTGQEDFIDVYNGKGAFRTRTEEITYIKTYYEFVDFLPKPKKVRIGAYEDNEWTHYKPAETNVYQRQTVASTATLRFTHKRSPFNNLKDAFIKNRKGQIIGYFEDSGVKSEEIAIERTQQVGRMPTMDFRQFAINEQSLNFGYENELSLKPIVTSRNTNALRNSQYSFNMQKNVQPQRNIMIQPSILVENQINFQANKQFNIQFEKNVNIQKQFNLQRQFNMQKQISLQVQKQVNLQRQFNMQKQISLQVQKQVNLQRQVNMQKQISLQVQKQVNLQRMETSLFITGIGNPPPTTIFKPFDNFMTEPKKRKGKNFGVGSGYEPSLTSTLFDIKGKRPGRFAYSSGLNIRPLIKEEVMKRKLSGNMRASAGKKKKRSQGLFDFDLRI